jgi:transcriptional regulator with XRE-family HTH domain
MPQRRPLTGDGKRSPRRRLADNLTRLREEAGLSLRELAEKVGWDRAHLSRMERGKCLGGPELIEALDTFYGTTPHLVDLWELARDGSAFRDRYQRAVELEAEAAVIEWYVPNIVPGLLQTEAYARALLWSTPHGPEDEDELEEQLVLRLGRQELLRRRSTLHLRVVIGESALRLALPDPAEWREQLARLVAAAAEPHVAIQVLPFSAGFNDLLDGSLMLVRTAEGRAAAWLESSKSGDLIEDAEEVERIRLSYDAVRDMALSPQESLAFIEQLMENLPCDPPAST